MLEIVNQLDGFDSRGNIKVPARRLLARHPHNLTWPLQVADIVTGRWQSLLTLSSCRLSRTTCTTPCGTAERLLTHLAGAPTFCKPCLCAAATAYMRRLSMARHPDGHRSNRCLT